MVYMWADVHLRAAALQQAAAMAAMAAGKSHADEEAAARVLWESVRATLPALRAAAWAALHAKLTPEGGEDLKGLKRKKGARGR
jgi:hypothetical protein